MKKEIIKSLTNEFESYVNFTDQGVEFWFARNLQNLLGYSEWRNFTQVINKAKTACETAGHRITDHFVDVNKMVTIGSETEREIKEIMLTRFACYLIAQNGDPQKESIAFAQNYFAVQTRKFEIIEQRINDWERLKAREKLTLSEKELSAVIYERGIDDIGFAIIRSKGDTALFGGFSTQEMKIKLNVPKNRPLSDFLPTITIKAKDFANEITVFNVKKKETLETVRAISEEHIKNSKGVRKLLKERGIVPEELPPQEDVKKLRRRLVSDEKKILTDVSKLDKDE
ncbi:MAG: DNA damage-inducible protein D [Candidatus Marinimicrobia bacterium]|nr:DNA damage-inducible protein D [Candidatus Neomarinimicrobiota bacterium]MCH7762653.1 DNA damage-inducible protein D [Candidatus Neomarinimicrobiota bacterium]